MATAKKTATKKAPAKKSATKKAPAKKSAGETSTSTKAASKTAAKKTAAKKTGTKAAATKTATKSAARKAPAKKTAAKKAPAPSTRIKTTKHSDNPSSTGKGKAKKEPAKQEDHCWPGYEAVPGKKAGTKGSCKPKKNQTPAEKKSDSMAAAGSKLRKAGGNKAAANRKR